MDHFIRKLQSKSQISSPENKATNSEENKLSVVDNEIQALLTSMLIEYKTDSVPQGMHNKLQDDGCNPNPMFNPNPMSKPSDNSKAPQPWKQSILESTKIKPRKSVDLSGLSKMVVNNHKQSYWKSMTRWEKPCDDKWNSVHNYNNNSSVNEAANWSFKGNKAVEVIKKANNSKNTFANTFWDKSNQSFSSITNWIHEVKSPRDQAEIKATLDNIDKHHDIDTNQNQINLATKPEENNPTVIDSTNFLNNQTTWNQDQMKDNKLWNSIDPVHGKHSLFKQTNLKLTELKMVKLPRYTSKKTIKPNKLPAFSRSSTQKINALSFQKNKYRQPDTTDEISLENMGNICGNHINEMKGIVSQLKKTLKNPKWNSDKQSPETLVSHLQSDEDAVSLCDSASPDESEEKHRQWQSKKLVYDSWDDDDVQDQINESFYIPLNSRFWLVFNYIIALSTFYSAILTPSFIISDTCYDTRYFTTKIEVILDCVFIIEIVISFFTPYTTFDETVITNKVLIYKNYLQSWFIIDLWSGLPWNTYFIFAFNPQSKKIPNIYGTTSINRFKILQMLRVCKIWKVFYSNNIVLSIREKIFDSVDFSISIRWISFFIYYWLIQHILACVFIIVAQTSNHNWINVYLSSQTRDFVSVYWTGSYFVLATVSSIGYGDISMVSWNEKIFNLFLMIFGVLWYTFAITSISTYIQNSDTKTEAFLLKRYLLEEIYREHNNMSGELYDKIYRFLKYEDKTNRIDKKVVFNCLSIGLRNSWINEMYKPIIKNFIFFKNYKNRDFIVRVILAFKPIIGSRYDVLVKEGDFIEEMMFVKDGALSLQIPLPNLHLHKITSKSIMNTLNQNFGSSNINTAHERRLIWEKTNNPKELYKQLLSKEALSRNDKIYAQIWEIRENEHFGDIWMFWNKRSPLSVKVKSKTIEWFLLSKTEAVEISTCFPQIWEEINTKSWYNMEQIERLIRNVVRLFIKSNLQHLRSLLKSKWTNELLKKYQDSVIKTCNIFNMQSVINSHHQGIDLHDLKSVDVSTLSRNSNNKYNERSVIQEIEDDDDDDDDDDSIDDDDRKTHSNKEEFWNASIISIDKQRKSNVNFSKTCTLKKSDDDPGDSTVVKDNASVLRNELSVTGDNAEWTERVEHNYNPDLKNATTSNFKTDSRSTRTKENHLAISASIAFTWDRMYDNVYILAGNNIVQTKHAIEAVASIIKCNTTIDYSKRYCTSENRNKNTSGNKQSKQGWTQWKHNDFGNGLRTKLKKNDTSTKEMNENVHSQKNKNGRRNVANIWSVLDEKVILKTNTRNERENNELRESLSWRIRKVSDPPKKCMSPDKNSENNMKHENSAKYKNRGSNGNNNLLKEIKDNIALNKQNWDNPAWFYQERFKEIMIQNEENNSDHMGNSSSEYDNSSVWMVNNSITNKGVSANKDNVSNKTKTKSNCSWVDKLDKTEHWLRKMNPLNNP